MERLQAIVWFTFPFLALLLLLALMGARGGIWLVFPFAIFALVVGAFYLMYLRARSHNRGRH